MKVKFINVPEGFCGDAKLYKCENYFKYSDLVGKDHDTNFIVISAADTYSGKETFIFPADEFGNVLDWGEMKGSLRGKLSHKDALKKGGYQLVEEF